MNERVREEAIQRIADNLRNMPFCVEFNVVRKPKGARIIFEVTREQMHRGIIAAARREEGKQA